MNQLSLFDAPPAAQPRAARPDLPLLILASADHVLGGPAHIEPNAHGIYPDDGAEHLVLPMLRKNWKGCPTAEITLLHHADGWLSAYGYQLSGGDFRGGGHGLSPKWHGGFLPDRRAALDYAAKQLERRIDGCEGKEAKRVREWLAGLT